MARVVIKKPLPTQTNGVKFFPSGSTQLDCILGGGWALGRVVNLVGDRSAGKTLLAIEACANFANRYPADRIAYREAEAAFDVDYAQTMGLPRGINYKDGLQTVEEFNQDLMDWLKACRADQPNLYILDSLDSLSDVAEMERDIGDNSYGTQKAKALSQLFRQRTKDMHDKHCTLIIISQIRDRIGISFGETKTRSGGKALDFYASQIVWLSEVKKIKRTVTGVDRIVGVEVKARNRKNKVGIPFRETEFTLLFGYGVDNHISMVDWIKKNKGEHHLPDGLILADYGKEISRARHAKDRETLNLLETTLTTACMARWREIEEALAPPISKYA